MSDPVFIVPKAGLTLGAVAEACGVPLPEGADPSQPVTGAAPLETAGPSDLAYMDNARYGDALGTTRALACLVSPRFAPRVPAGTIALVTRDPYRAYAGLLARLYEEAMRPGSLFAASGVSPGAHVHPQARLEDGVRVDPGAVVGPGAEIGSGTVLGPNAVIGPNVRIGRDCSIGAGATLTHALVGNRVIIHPGARIGQDGFGFAMGAGGHIKVPQVGRVIIQDDVEIGANTTIDRGRFTATRVGRGTKVDNLVMIAHNVQVGEQCLIVAQTGISGSTHLGDRVTLAGQVGVTGHLEICNDVTVMGKSVVAKHVLRPGVYAGIPIRPIAQWKKAVARLNALARETGGSDSGQADEA